MSIDQEILAIRRAVRRVLPKRKFPATMTTYDMVCVALEKLEELQGHTVDFPERDLLQEGKVRGSNPNDKAYSAPDKTFVFGSNKAGRHGAGAAKHAYRYRGAVYGVGEGHRGQSYAIPTKDKRLSPLSLMQIAEGVERFLAYARRHPEYEFEVTAIGTGLAGYKVAEIAPMFEGAPRNCHLCPEFAAWLADAPPVFRDPPPGVHID